MENTPQKKELIRPRLYFLISPEDTTDGCDQLPPWATPCYLLVKMVLWWGVGVAAAVSIAQL
jgi:hypothetical protein